MKKDYIVELREEEADELMDEHWVGELVRCKDCCFATEHHAYSVFGKPLYVCNHVRQIGREGLAIHTDDWFCADGEHK